ncbi:MAG TPA: hypothetical protein VMT11_10010 [Myxococcaceae bacterium]|nr:hypothetical protein [Myxococcaceae bacterium]
MTLTIREAGESERLFRIRRLAADRWEAAAGPEVWRPIARTGADPASVEGAYQLFLAVSRDPGHGGSSEEDQD